MSHPQQLSDWTLLISLLGPTGTCGDVLSTGDKAAVRERCDGFGRMSWGEMVALGCEWDWSHVRDSSEGAVRDAAELARRLLAVVRLREVERRVAEAGAPCASGVRP